MATAKRRLNITLPDHLNTIIQMLAKRDGIADAAKTVELIELGLELSDTEDKYLSMIGDTRASEDVEYLSHDEAWS